jgi:hypothetical protein
VRHKAIDDLAKNIGEIQCNADCKGFAEICRRVMVATDTMVIAVVIVAAMVSHIIQKDMRVQPGESEERSRRLDAL